MTEIKGFIFPGLPEMNLWPIFIIISGGFINFQGDKGMQTKQDHPSYLLVVLISLKPTKMTMDWQ